MLLCALNISTSRSKYVPSLPTSLSLILIFGMHSPRDGTAQHDPSAFRPTHPSKHRQSLSRQNLH